MAQRVVYYDQATDERKGHITVKGSKLVGSNDKYQAIADDYMSWEGNTPVTFVERFGDWDTQATYTLTVDSDEDDIR